MRWINLIQRAGKIQTIVLDPGHGGFDKGAASTFGNEKSFALDVARQLRPLLQRLPAEETGRFPNLELFETADATVYFDLRSQGDYPWASPVQTSS